MVNMIMLKAYLRLIFGGHFLSKIQKYKIDFKNQEQLFNKDILSKLKECENPEEQNSIFDTDILSKLEKELDVEDQKEISCRAEGFHFDFKIVNMLQ